MTTLAIERPGAVGFTRRGACPAISAPMKTGDGLLVRLNPVAGLSPQALAGLCDAAQMHGNGVVEVTARGSVQVRGLTERSASLFAQAVDRIGISVRTGVPVQTGVLSGIDPQEIADPTGLAENIRTAIARSGLEGRLGPKVSVVIDGGGSTALEEVASDVWLTALGGDSWMVHVAGNAVFSGVEEAARDACLAVLSEIAKEGINARARDLPENKFGFLFKDLHKTGESKQQEFVHTTLIGWIPLKGGRLSLGIALPFGSTDANSLKILAEEAASLGVTDIRPAPKRTLAFICESEWQAAKLRAKSETLGFITSPDDPRQAVSACPGTPECASGYFATRSLASDLTSGFGSILDGSMHVHVSGCAKGCAHPAAASLTLVGNCEGIGLVANGTARDEPLVFADRDAAGRGLANLARLVAAERRDGETTAQAVRRIGVSALAEAFRQGGT